MAGSKLQAPQVLEDMIHCVFDKKKPIFDMSEDKQKDE